MPSSDVQIVNAALIRIGADRITALTDINPRAIAMNEVYQPTVDRLLRSHNWNFAQIRVALQEVTNTPIYGYAHQFQLPQDPLCLMVLETSLADDAPWRIEHYENAAASQSYRVLVTDESSVSILYVGRLTDVTQWDPLFATYVSLDLAMQTAYKLTRNAQLLAMIKDELRDIRLQAKARDGQEGRALKRWSSDVLTDVR